MIWIVLVWAAVFIGCMIVFLKSSESDSSSSTSDDVRIMDTKPAKIDHDKLQAAIRQKEKQAKQEYKEWTAKVKWEERQKLFNKTPNNNFMLPSTKFAGPTQPSETERSINVQPTKRETFHIHRELDYPSATKMSDEQQILEKNYYQIDKALYKEKLLREDTKADISKHKEQKTRYLNKARTIWIVVWIIAVSILTPIIYSIFSCEHWIPPLIASLIIVSPIAIYAICSLTADITADIANYGKEKELENERKIVKMYTELLNNVDVYQFLGIPSNMVFDENDLPNTYKTDFTLPRPYGNYTRFVAPHSGSRYHVKRGCSGAYHPVHIYDLSLNEYRFKWRYLSACQVCVGYRDSVEVPKWFIYYRKVRKITNEYEIKANYRK